MFDLVHGAGRSLPLTLVAALGGLLFGYDTAVISGAVASLDTNFIAPLALDETRRDLLSGFTVSSALAGCIVGGALAGKLADRWGRRTGLIVAAALFLVSAIGSALPELGVAAPGTTTAAVLAAFIAYRVLCGTAIGIASMLAPLYIAEIAPPAQRGRLVSLYQLAIVVGIVAVYFINWAIAASGDAAWLDRVGWRLMLGSEGGPAALFLLLLLRVPDTPRWLVMRGRVDEARAVVARIAPQEDAVRLLAEIRRSLDAAPGAALFSFGPRVVLAGLALSVFQQLVGINAVLYYAPLMFRNLGAGAGSALWQTVIVGAVNLLATLVAIATVDRYGRRRLLLAGSAAMALPMLGLGALFGQESQGGAALLCVLLYIAGFAVSWGPVVWVLLSEMFPGPIRGRAMAWAVAAQWIANLLVSWSFKVMDGNSALTATFHHGFAYYLYGVMSVLAGVFVWKCIPETSGRSLESMDHLWAADARAGVAGTTPR